MRRIVTVILLLVLTLGVAACGTSPMKYEPQAEMPLTQAVRVIDRLIMEQHPTWRPDFVEINGRFILLGYGSVTRGHGSAVVLSDGVAIGAGSSRTRTSGERVYFESTDKVVLYSWKRKFRQWYVVSLVGKNRQHMLRTRSLEEAKQMANALQVVINAYERGNL